MTFSSIEVQISPEQVFSAVESLSEGELDSSVGQILQIRGKRKYWVKSDAVWITRNCPALD